MRKKFTLLELLIVIAVITILLSILLPSLHRSRELTKRAVCLSNLSQYYRGLVTHSHINDGALPAGQPVSGSAAGIFAIKRFRWWHGHGFLHKDKIIEDIYISDCPSNTHPIHTTGKTNEAGDYGGFPTSGRLLRTITSSYQYRSTFNEPDYRAPSLIKDEPGDAVMSDHSSSNYSVKFTHKEGHNISYIDGSAAWNSDKTLLYLSSGPGNHVERETVFWSKVDRE